MLRLTEKIPLFWVAYAKLERLLLVRMLHHHVVSDEDDGEVGWTHACMDEWVVGVDGGCMAPPREHRCSPAPTLSSR